MRGVAQVLTPPCPHSAISLSLARVRLVLEATLRPPDDAIQDDPLLGVVVAGAQPGLSGQLILFAHRRLEPIKLVLRTGGGEIVTMDVQDDASFSMPEDTR